MKTRKLFTWLVGASLLGATACDNATDLGSDGSGGEGGSTAQAGSKTGGAAGAKAGTSSGGQQIGASGAGGTTNGGDVSVGGASKAGAESSGGATLLEGGASSGGATLLEGGASSAGAGPDLVGSVCESGGSSCGPSLACCYPCGIEGCDHVCQVPCAPSAPGCIDGCFALP